MDEITILLDVGNCLFFFGGFLQLIKTIKNKKNLEGFIRVNLFIIHDGSFPFYYCRSAAWVVDDLHFQWR
jgi:hypothetical protein